MTGYQQGFLYKCASMGVPERRARGLLKTAQQGFGYPDQMPYGAPFTSYSWLWQQPQTSGVQPYAQTGVPPWMQWSQPWMQLYQMSRQNGNSGSSVFGNTGKDYMRSFVDNMIRVSRDKRSGQNNRGTNGNDPIQSPPPGEDPRSQIEYARAHRADMYPPQPSSNGGSQGPSAPTSSGPNEGALLADRWKRMTPEQRRQQASLIGVSPEDIDRMSPEGQTGAFTRMRDAHRANRDADRAKRNRINEESMRRNNTVLNGARTNAQEQSIRFNDEQRLMRSYEDGYRRENGLGREDEIPEDARADLLSKAKEDNQVLIDNRNRVLHQTVGNQSMTDGDMARQDLVPVRLPSGAIAMVDRAGAQRMHAARSSPTPEQGVAMARAMGQSWANQDAMARGAARSGGSPGGQAGGPAGMSGGTTLRGTGRPVRVGPAANGYGTRAGVRGIPRAH